MGAVYELWWVIIMFGGPALIAVLWEFHLSRKWRKQWRELTDWNRLGDAIQKSLEKGHSDQMAKQRKDVSKYSLSLDTEEIAHMDTTDKEFSRLVDLAERNKQKRRDDRIFDTVKEYRDELD